MKIDWDRGFLHRIYLRYHCKWTYERSYVWTAEKDMNLWLIIAVKHTTWAVVKLNFPAFISQLLRLCVPLRWSIKNSYLMIAFVMTPLILLSRCPVIFVYWRKSIGLKWINWRVNEIACVKSCVLFVLLDWLLVKRKCNLERYPSSFVLYSLKGRCAVVLWSNLFRAGTTRTTKFICISNQKGGTFASSKIVFRPQM